MRLLFFLLKTTFWLSLILLFVPLGLTGQEDEPTVNPVNAMSAAQATFSDLSGFCERNPATCETGSEIASVVAYRAKLAFREVYEYLQEDARPSPHTPEGLVAEPIEVVPADDFDAVVLPSEGEAAITGSLPALQTTGEAERHGTLTAEDLSIPWAGDEGALSAQAARVIAEQGVRRVSTAIDAELAAAYAGRKNTRPNELSVPIPWQKPLP